MNDDSADAPAFGEKLESLLANHRKFVVEFQNSLRNSRHFIRLADNSMGEEPDNTVDMLNQIQDIDLLGHVRRLSEEFDSVQGYLVASPMAAESEAYRVEMAGVADDYESLEAEAADQMEQIERLLRALEE